ncbi:beta-ketoacyl synthase N-terminal-like domain-containing protein, partial [Streptomyces massasporeus]
DSLRTRRAYFAQLEERASRLEQEREAQAKVAVAAERARIARELHDVVAHNVSVMVVQADGAAYVMDSSPETAKQALDTISTTGRQALAEMPGLPPRGLSPATGVFVGASYQHYKDYNISPELDAPAGLGNHNAFLANRVSFFLDLHGPSMTIDTLCSSSLVALHTAVRSIRAGECEQAVVAGVHLGMSPQYFQLGSRLRSFSPSNALRPFDAGADGFVPGEGVVTVVLKPLRAALRDGDRIRGVVKGSAVNHGGRTSGLTVPSSAAQESVISAALVDAGVSVESIGLVEAHGTGTSLGDPIEVEGLTRAWRGVTSRSQFCALGSLKGNVGHLEPAAGLAGLVKVLLSMERGVVPPSLHVVRPNDHIRFEGTPFFLADRVSEWPRPVDGPRRGAVSAFGMGGVNAHVILEEAPAVPAREVAAQESYLVRVDAADETS